jgi:AbrB family looped-hinge helix DNA binding protein
MEKIEVVLSKHGRLTLPKFLRDRLGWTPGVKLIVEDRSDGVALSRDVPTSKRAAP